MFGDLGHRYEEAFTLTHLGDTHHSAGHAVSARAAWLRALDILTELGHPDAEAVKAKVMNSQATDSAVSHSGSGGR
jgi:hypothetical protein